MSSRRIYITLNTDKEKDRIIGNYLSQSYNEKDAIKEALYRIATNCIEREQSGAVNIKKEQLLEKNTAPKRSNEEQIGTNCTDSAEKYTKEQNRKSIKSMQSGAKIKKNELEQLKGFM